MSNYRIQFQIPEMFTAFEENTRAYLYILCCIQSSGRITLQVVARANYARRYHEYIRVYNCIDVYRSLLFAKITRYLFVSCTKPLGISKLHEI